MERAVSSNQIQVRASANIRLTQYCRNHTSAQAADIHPQNAPEDFYCNLSRLSSADFSHELTSTHEPLLRSTTRMSFLSCAQRLRKLRSGHCLPVSVICHLQPQWRKGRGSGCLCHKCRHFDSHSPDQLPANLVRYDELKTAAGHERVRRLSNSNTDCVSTITGGSEGSLRAVMLCCQTSPRLDNIPSWDCHVLPQSAFQQSRIEKGRCLHRACLKFPKPVSQACHS